MLSAPDWSGGAGMNNPKKVLKPSGRCIYTKMHLVRFAIWELNKTPNNCVILFKKNAE